jgi:hypothetical protein
MAMMRTCEAPCGWFDPCKLNPASANSDKPTIWGWHSPLMAAGHGRLCLSRYKAFCLKSTPFTLQPQLYYIAAVVTCSVTMLLCRLAEFLHRNRSFQDHIEVPRSISYCSLLKPLSSPTGTICIPRERCFEQWHAAADDGPRVR